MKHGSPTQNDVEQMAREQEREREIIISSSDYKGKADYHCDGIDDQEEINEAIKETSAAIAVMCENIRELRKHIKSFESRLDMAYRDNNILQHELFRQKGKRFWALREARHLVKCIIRQQKFIETSGNLARAILKEDKS